MTREDAVNEVAEKFNKEQQQQATMVHMDPRVIAVIEGEKAQFELMQRRAGMYAKSALVPSTFRGDMASCGVAIMLATRMGIDPFMLMQNMYVVHGRPGLQGQLIIAMVNDRGPFVGPIQWRWERNTNGKAIACTAYAVHTKTGEECSEKVTWDMVVAEKWNVDGKNRKTGETIRSKWNTMPELMFKYRSAAFLARATCPEVTMGLSIKEEIEDSVPLETVRVELSPDHDVPDFPTAPDRTEEVKAAVAGKGPELEKPPAETKSEEAPPATKPKEPEPYLNWADTEYSIEEISRIAIKMGMHEEMYTDIMRTIGFTDDQRSHSPKRLRMLAQEVQTWYVASREIGQNETD